MQTPSPQTNDNQLPACVACMGLSTPRALSHWSSQLHAENQAEECSVPSCTLPDPARTSPQCQAFGPGRSGHIHTIAIQYILNILHQQGSDPPTMKMFVGRRKGALGSLSQRVQPPASCSYRMMRGGLPRRAPGRSEGESRRESAPEREGARLTPPPSGQPRSTVTTAPGHPLQAANTDQWLPTRSKPSAQPPAACGVAGCGQREQQDAYERASQRPLQQSHKLGR